MFLDNLLPSFIGALAAPFCFVKRIRYPEMVSFGMLASLKRMKLNRTIHGIDSIWDIGANHGQFAFMANSVWPELPIYSFEPDPATYHKLENHFKKFSIQGRTFSYALGNKLESKQLVRYSNNVNNSLLENNLLRDDVLDKYLVECITLDKIALEFPEVKNAFLKLDVQGFELMVLAGANNFLKNCLFVQIEVSFSPSYLEGAHAGEILTKMNELGFECIEILDLLRDKTNGNKLVEADILFSRVKGGNGEN